ncbi:hypothetical protein HY933_00210 [Candidatus Falkowbacteria bacterium]|nr:hypothetical protein [Candidatus Falkowbacteria bacterium]
MALSWDQTFEQFRLIWQEHRGDHSGGLYQMALVAGASGLSVVPIILLFGESRTATAFPDQRLIGELYPFAPGVVVFRSRHPDRELAYDGWGLVKRLSEPVRSENTWMIHLFSSPGNSRRYIMISFPPPHHCKVADPSKVAAVHEEWGSGGGTTIIPSQQWDLIQRLFQSFGL